MDFLVSLWKNRNAAQAEIFRSIWILADKKIRKHFKLTWINWKGRQD